MLRVYDTILRIRLAPDTGVLCPNKLRGCPPQSQRVSSVPITNSCSTTALQPTTRSPCQNQPEKRRRRARIRMDLKERIQQPKRYRPWNQTSTCCFLHMQRRLPTDLYITIVSNSHHRPNQTHHPSPEMSSPLLSLTPRCRQSRRY